MADGNVTGDTLLQAARQAPQQLAGVVGHLARQMQAQALLGAPGGAAAAQAAELSGAVPAQATGAQLQSQEVLTGGALDGGGQAAEPAASGTSGGTGDTASSTSDAAPAPAAPVQPKTHHTEVGTFVVYPDDFDGPMPPDTPETAYRRQAAFDTEVADRRARVAAQAERAISTVEGLLSYGVLDLLVTDAEANKALVTLAQLPLLTLQPTLARVDVERLIANLPEGSKFSPAYAKFVVALGPERGVTDRAYVLPGALTFANSNAEWAMVTRFLAACDGPYQVMHIATMGPEHLKRLALNLPTDVALDQTALDMAFLLLPDDAINAMRKVMARRFGFRVGARKEGQWTSDGLRRAYTILQQLPPGHVQDNDELDRLLVEKGSDGSGYYQGGNLDDAVVSYTDITKTGSYGGIDGVDADGNPTTVNLHTNVNLFDTVLRHEIGHAVDAKIGASGPGGYARTQDHAGAWNTYGDSGAWVNALIATGMDGFEYPDTEAYAKAMRHAVANGQGFNEALAALKADGKVEAKVTEAPANVGGPVAAVLTTDLWQSGDSPWYEKPNRATVSGRQWHQAYSSTFVSYKNDARLQSGISAYQFRAPGEWFAEAYACYYSDHDSATGARPGTRLRTRDSKTADWFDRAVDKGHSLPKETGQGEAEGGSGGSTTSAGDGGARSQAGQ